MGRKPKASKEEKPKYIIIFNYLNNIIENNIKDVNIISEKDNRITMRFEANKRGDHFKYSKEKGWDEILIGTHSHENEDILDAIGDISFVELPLGTKRLLSIKKKKDSNDNEEFKVTWDKYSDVLPQIPETLKNSTVHGGYVWKEQFIPTKHFNVVE